MLRRIKWKMAKGILVGAISISLILSVGCAKQSSQNTQASINDKKVSNTIQSEKDTSEKLMSVNKKDSFSYQNVKPKIEETQMTYTSEDQLVRIEKKQSYYEVYLDLEKGSHYEVGRAYGEAIREIYPEFAEIMEPYLYENMYMAFPELTDDYTPVSNRLEKIKKSIRPEYLEEIQGMVSSLVSDDKGFLMNGKLSEEEVYLMQFVPDVLRGTQCSGLAVYGGESATGHTITVRILEWLMGNENQMASAHAVTHFKNNEKSFTSYGVLGLLEAISVHNAEGVFGGILDSSTEEPFTMENKKSYPFELRYAIEQFGTAKEVGDYMTSIGKQFTFSHNLLITDKSKAYIVENSVGAEGICALREPDSKLHHSMEWNHPEAVAVVNAFALDENKDNMTESAHNMIRWRKFNERLMQYDQVTPEDLKDLVTQDNPNAYGSSLYSDRTYQMIVIDSETGNVDIAFAPKCDEFPLKPDFIRVSGKEK